MSRKYFGTDGVRGTVGTFPIVPDFVVRVGYAAGKVLAKHSADEHPTVLIGKPVCRPAFRVQVLISCSAARFPRRLSPISRRPCV